MTDWTTADRISDRLVAVVNDELQTMRLAGRVDPLQILAGQLLALLAFSRTAPLNKPREYEHVLNDAALCLRAMMERHE